MVTIKLVDNPPVHQIKSHREMVQQLVRLLDGADVEVFEAALGELVRLRGASGTVTAWMQYLLGNTPKRTGRERKPTITLERS